MCVCARVCMRAVESPAGAAAVLQPELPWGCSSVLRRTGQPGLVLRAGPTGAGVSHPFTSTWVTIVDLPFDFAELRPCSAFSLPPLLPPCQTQETIGDLVLKDFEDDFVVEIDTKVEGWVWGTCHWVQCFTYFLFICRTWLIKSLQCCSCSRNLKNWIRIEFIKLVLINYELI